MPFVNNFTTHAITTSSNSLFKGQFFNLKFKYVHNNHLAKIRFPQTHNNVEPITLSKNEMVKWRFEFIKYFLQNTVKLKKYKNLLCIYCGRFVGGWPAALTCPYGYIDDRHFWCANGPHHQTQVLRATKITVLRWRVGDAVCSLSDVEWQSTTWASPCVPAKFHLL